MGTTFAGWLGKAFPRHRHLVVETSSEAPQARLVKALDATGSLVASVQVAPSEGDVVTTYDALGRLTERCSWTAYLGKSDQRVEGPLGVVRETFRMTDPSGQPVMEEVVEVSPGEGALEVTTGTERVLVRDYQGSVLAAVEPGAPAALRRCDSFGLDRVHGGSAGPMGRYRTSVRPSGPLQAQLDSALAPQWGNTAQTVTQIRVPSGTTILGTKAKLPRRFRSIWTRLSPDPAGRETSSVSRMIHQ